MTKSRITVSLLLISFVVLPSAFAEDLYSFNINNKEIGEVIQTVSQMTGKSFVFDGAVRGKVSITNTQKVSSETAYNQLASALQVNGYTIVPSGAKYMIMSGRNAQRSSVPVVTELPSIEPDQMMTYVYKTKFVSADEINKSLRILNSKDGELAVGPNNTLIISDYVSSLHRIAAILKEVDVAASGSTTDAQKANKRIVR